MSDISYNRCTQDDWKAGTAEIGANPETGKPIEINVNGVSAVMAIQSAILSLTVAMKAGHEPDFLQKIALALLPKVQADPHSLCPLAQVIGMVAMMMAGETLGFDKEGNFIIDGFDTDTCLNEEYSDGEDEEGLDESGGGGGIND